MSALAINTASAYITDTHIHINDLTIMLATGIEPLQIGNTTTIVAEVAPTSTIQTVTIGGETVTVDSWVDNVTNPVTSLITVTVPSGIALSPGSYLLTVTDDTGPVNFYNVPLYAAADVVLGLFSIETDLVLPVITLIGASTINVDINTSYTDAGANVSDDVDGDSVLVAQGSVVIGTLGTYTLTYDYTDVAGNVAQTVYRSVVVKDPNAVTSNKYAVLRQVLSPVLS